MKKIINLLFISIFIFSIFISCSENDKEAASSGKVEVNLWHYFGPNDPDGPVFMEYIERYNNMQDKVEILAQFMPREDLLKQYSMGLIADELPDMGMIDNPDHASFSSVGLFEDITDRVNAWDDNEFLEGPLKSTMYEGRIYGIPQNNNCLSLFYDIDMLKEAGVDVPTTWEELEEAAKKLTKGDVKGLAIALVKSEEGTFQYLPWMLSAGSDINQLNSDESVKALEFITSLVNNGYASKEVLIWNQADVQNQFSAGRAAMMINGPWNIAAVEKGAPDKNWGVTKIPMDKQFSSVLGGENFAIIKGKKVDEAWDFLKWFCGTEISQEYNKRISKFSPKSNIDVDSMWGDDEIMKVFAEQMEYAMPRGPHPKWPQISTAIITAVHESVSGLKTPKEALDNAQKVVDSLNN